VLNPAHQKALMIKPRLFSSKNYPVAIDRCEKTTISAEMEGGKHQRFINLLFVDVDQYPDLA